MASFESWLDSKLSERKEKSLLRELSQKKSLIDFTSNDYLGLARSTSLYEQTLHRLRALGFESNGATGSRLLSGNASYTQTVEKKLAAIFKADAALIFNSGYTANLAVLSSIPQRGDTILYDELAHACIKDGARLSLAQRFSFRHSDLDDLERKIKRSEGKVFIAVESIYSMDGDECPLKALTVLAERSGAMIILDEAHSTGVLGEQGSGLATTLGLEEKIAIRIHTFGKAMGIHGACVVGSQSLCDFLINFARPFIYTTALPPHSVSAIESSFDILKQSPDLQKALKEKVSLFVDSVEAMTNRTTSNSAIQTAIFPGNENVRRAAAHLQHHGFDVRPILSPTVPIGEERLRICLHTFNKDQDIRKLCSLLLEWNAARIK